MTLLLDILSSLSKCFARLLNLLSKRVHLLTLIRLLRLKHLHLGDIHRVTIAGKIVLRVVASHPCVGECID